jgi:hypothetical protein
VVISSLILAALILILKKIANMKKDKLDSDAAATPSIRQAMQTIKINYGTAIARNVERIFRLETAHFASGGFLATNAAGQLAFAEHFPYGWYSLVNLWNSQPQRKPTQTVRLNGYDYLKFANVEDAAFAVAEILKLRGNNPGAYFSNDAAQQAEYNAKLVGIEAKYV